MIKTVVTEKFLDVYYFFYFKVILCASEHICSIVRYCFRSFKQLKKDPLHVLTDANVLVLIDTDQTFLLTDTFRSRQTFTDQ